MKKLIFTLVISFFVLSTNIGYAQFQAYEWEYYHLSFEIPKTHKIIANTADNFESGDDNTYLQLYPYKDITESPESMIKSVLDNIEGGVKIFEEGDYEVGGYNGHWITCEINKYPEWQYWYIGFIDPASDVNFYAIIWYKKGNANAKNIANDMSFKFKKM